MGQNGALNIVDLGQEYSLVTFTSEYDQHAVLINNPWLINDQYSSVNEWSANLCTTGDVIEQIVV